VNPHLLSLSETLVGPSVLALLAMHDVAAAELIESQLVAVVVVRSDRQYS
jgi:hypothetical protein